MESTVRNHRHEFWKEHIQKWQESGLSQPSYCDIHGIKLTTFRYYRSRVLNSQGFAESLNFVSVQSKPAVSIQSAGLQLLLPNGIRVGVFSDISESLLKMVLNVAGQTVC